ncbi:hypothetical protein ALC57_01364 [Trachymyrmex cornetzi]|uniref:Uncharacterized protein n=1 Tax=Trachymyrmex cornetzi TaxID=471704 RepID=A0A195EM88_9HYME|nr:hypothetical protein ALC57_01364 [Trachymyrmex cornetzi]
MTVVVWTQEIERCCGGCCIRAAVAQRQCYFNLTEKRKHVARRCGHGSVFSLFGGKGESECNLLGLIKHRLVKHSRREPISPEHRLVITLL